MTEQEAENGNLPSNDKTSTSLVEYREPEELQKIFNLDLPTIGQGQTGLLQVLQQILQYSVNTWHQGFLDKLYASTNAPGVAAELILAVLNTNVHVYQVSPVLTLVEKHTAKQLALLFGLNGPHSGGISVQGGSASNTTSIVIARNTLYPESRIYGNGDYRFVIFTSGHGHYSIEKAAQMLGLGSSAVWSVPVDKRGCMIPSELEKLVQLARAEGRTPFYVNATAGTTVLGSFDPFHEVAEICKRYNLWFHVDGSWGGSFIFSERQKSKLSGAERANSIAINPHKMLGVPVTCSFLLAADIRQFHRANTLPAGYLFHNNNNNAEPNFTNAGDLTDHAAVDSQTDSPEVWDLADLTLQCGRRADSLKLFLSWTYYGSQGYQRRIDGAMEVAIHLATLLDNHPDFVLVSDNPPPCLQVCFYYAPGKKHVYEADDSDDSSRATKNSRVTEQVTRAIINQGFMVDYAPPTVDDTDLRGKGKFFRCVVNISTKKETVEGLIHAIEQIGPAVIDRLRRDFQ